MVIAVTTYEQFKNLKTLLGTQFRVVYQHEEDGTAFRAVAISDRSIAAQFDAPAKPEDWDLLMGAVSTRCLSISFC